MNVIYVDIPAPAGWSQGETMVDTAPKAAEQLYDFIVQFLTSTTGQRFIGRPLHLLGYSAGGRLAALTAQLIISRSSNSPVFINIAGVILNGAWLEPSLYYPATIQFLQAQGKLSEQDAVDYQSRFDRTGGCKAKLVQCWNDNTAVTCKDAYNTCWNDIEKPLARLTGVNWLHVDYNRGDWSAIGGPDANAREQWYTSIQSDLLMNNHGHWIDHTEDVFDDYLASGDGGRSTQPAVKAVLQAGVRVSLVTGDKDANCPPQFQLAFASTFGYYPQCNLRYRQFDSPGKSQFGELYESGNLKIITIYGGGHELMDQNMRPQTTDLYAKLVNGWTI